MKSPLPPTSYSWRCIQGGGAAPENCCTPPPLLPSSVCERTSPGGRLQPSSSAHSPLPKLLLSKESLGRRGNLGRSESPSTPASADQVLPENAHFTWNSVDYSCPRALSKTIAITGMNSKRRLIAWWYRWRQIRSLTEKSWPETVKEDPANITISTGGREGCGKAQGCDLSGMTREGTSKLSVAELKVGQMCKRPEPWKWSPSHIQTQWKRMKPLLAREA